MIKQLPTNPELIEWISEKKSAKKCNDAIILSVCINSMESNKLKTLQTLTFYKIGRIINSLKDPCVDKIQI